MSSLILVAPSKELHVGWDLAQAMLIGLRSDMIIWDLVGLLLHVQLLFHDKRSAHQTFVELLLEQNVWSSCCVLQVINQIVFENNLMNDHVALPAGSMGK